MSSKYVKNDITGQLFGMWTVIGRDEKKHPSPVEEELLEKLIYRCHANPYWLFDYECEALFGVEEPDADAVRMGDEPCVFATADVILRWIREGKPKKTSWEDSL